MTVKSENMRAVDRAIDVLECFAVERRPLAIGELERRVSLSRPTLYRILSTLISRKYVRKDGEPPRYRLDIGAGRLADAWNNSLDVARLAEPLMRNLHDRYDETVALYLRKDNIRLCVSEMPSRQALSYSRGLGHSGSLLRGASGLAMLAFLDGAEAEQIIEQDRDKSHARAARRRLPEIRDAGYAVSSGDFIAGAQAIASPIFDRRGDVVGSLGIFGPSVRFNTKRVGECAKAVKQSASLLSSLLGHA
ncbi:MAG: IclR family transcriptional regulator [Xanthobacteraceae bacterium]|nr:IclR family transcriptional regulator [Xanthobacteraceae bacterium]